MLPPPAGRQQSLLRASPAAPAENNGWVTLEARARVARCHRGTPKPFKEGEWEAP